MKGIIKLALLALALWRLPNFCLGITDGFALSHIGSNLPFHAEWRVEESAKEPLEPIFQQPFSYLTSGGQAFVFISEDGCYVLKFFKHHKMRLHPFIAVLPLPHFLNTKREKQLTRRLGKLYRDFASYKLAFEELSEETKLIFVHLNKSQDLHLKATLVDKLHICHCIDLDNYEFVLQKRAEPAYSYLEKLVAQKEIDKAKNALESICHLLLKRCNKGIFDEDANVRTNIGFFHEEPMIIDVGRFKWDIHRKEKTVQKRDLKKMTDPLIDFLKPLSPELASHLKAYREEI